MKCVLQTQREEVCDQALLRGQVPHKGTEKLAADVPGGGARPAFCPEHVPSFHGKGKNNHKPVLNSKGEGSPPPPPHTRKSPVVEDRTLCGKQRRVWKGVVWPEGRVQLGGSTDGVRGRPQGAEP